MIIGIGTDIVDCTRFADMATDINHPLRAYFTPHEIRSCTQNPINAAQRFAARFAAKEAFFKAFNQSLPGRPLRLISVVPFIEVHNHPISGVPFLEINWQALGLPAYQAYAIHLSLSHIQSMAIAFVTISEPSA